VKNKTKVFTALFIVLGLISATSYADYKKHKGGHKMEQMTEQLSLSDAQRKKAKAVHKNMQEMQKMHRKGRMNERDSMADLLDDTSFDENKALAIIRNKHEKMENHAKKMISAMAAFSNSLSSDQKQKLQTLLKDKSYFGGGHKMGHDKKDRGYKKRHKKNHEKNCPSGQDDSHYSE
jgi:Spy/CpxP family protein refolding chaperone